MIAAVAGARRFALCKTSLYGPISGADETLVIYAWLLHSAGHDVTVVLLHRPPVGDVFYQRLLRAGIPITIIADRSYMFDLLRRVRRLAGSIQQALRPSKRVAAEALSVADAPVQRRRSIALTREIARRLEMRNLDQTRRHFEAAGYAIAHVITPDSGAEIMIRAASASGTPVLYHEMGTPFHMPELDGSYQRLATVTPLCTRLAALSPVLARQWEQYLPHHAGILVQPLVVAQPKRWSFPRRAGDDATIIGFAARLETGKGPGILIDAVAMLLRRGHVARLRVAGSGVLKTSLMMQSRDAGISDFCEFVGAYDSRDGCSAFLQTLDVFVLPSLAEGTPNSVIEAMACGVAVVAFDVGGVADIIAPDAGILVPPGDTAALADAIGRLIDDSPLRRAMGEAGRRRYEASYSPEVGLAGLLATYEHFMSPSRPRPVQGVSHRDHGDTC